LKLAIFKTELINLIEHLCASTKNCNCKSDLDSLTWSEVWYVLNCMSYLQFTLLKWMEKKNFDTPRWGKIYFSTMFCEINTAFFLGKKVEFTENYVLWTFFANNFVKSTLSLPNYAMRCFHEIFSKCTVEKQEIYSHQKIFREINSTVASFFCKYVTFTKFLSKMCESNFRYFHTSMFWVYAHWIFLVFSTLKSIFCLIRFMKQVKSGF